jgi:lipoate-protein ligase A
MALDEALSVSVRRGDSPSTLRLYSWNRPAVSLGAFQKISDIDIDFCRSCNVPIVRRPTGGRAILHGDELTYSFSAMNAGLFSGGLMDSYRKLGTAFNRCFELIGLSCAIKKDLAKGRELMRSPICFASTSLGEISSGGKKIIGSAQKRWKDGFLQQGSIPFDIDRRRLAAVFRIPPQTVDYNSLTGLRELLPDFDAATFRDHLIAAFEETFSVTLLDSQPSPQELEAAHLLASGKYPR